MRLIARLRVVWQPAQPPWLVRHAHKRLLDRDCTDHLETCTQALAKLN